MKGSRASGDVEVAFLHGAHHSRVLREVFLKRSRCRHRTGAGGEECVVEAASRVLLVLRNTLVCRIIGNESATSTTAQDEQTRVVAYTLLR